MIDAKLTRRAFLGLAATAPLAACGGDVDGDTASVGGDENASIIMVTTSGGVYDQSLNELAWSGLERLASESGWDVDYIESIQESEYFANLDAAANEDPSLIWGIGFAIAEAINKTAEENPEDRFAALECTNELGLSNLTSVTFKSEQPSFVVGYIAARMTKKGVVGFLGGVDGDVMEAFRYGYFAGIEYANKELGTSVSYVWQMAETWTDAAKGKSFAQKMIEDGADVIYAAAGPTGVGVIEACDEAGVYAIGVDTDQAHLAPKTVIASALKRTDEAVYRVTKELVSGETASGQDLVLGFAEDAVDIAETHDLLPDEVYEAALGLIELIKAGDIVVPTTEEGLKDYVASL